MREQDAERPASENRNAGRPASRAAISVRPGPALLPRRIAYRAFAVSAPHLGLTLDLPELCRSTERAGLWGKHARHRWRERSCAGSTSRASRPRSPEPQAPVPAPRCDASQTRPSWTGTARRIEHIMNVVKKKNATLLSEA